MDFDSPDVEKDFPGLYASESVDGKSKKSKEESDYSEGDHEKVSKKDLLIGRRKEKKDKGKDRGYAALEGESSPEEELEAK
ncbi:ralA-binding protein 1-like [Teleopsis dalmanni]|nr:ralA-binding protein 1-like [Teleopsis dalmanni]